VLKSFRLASHEPALRKVDRVRLGGIEQARHGAGRLFG
jgi:hypothetical protein